jgi:hypothetical protein
MKNIHVLKTSKPSKLLKDLVDKTYQFKKEVSFGNRIELPLNIYITSDEEIKDGDYGLGFALGIKGVGRGHYVFKQDGTNVGKLNAICNGSKKIILTTDQDLIGVQAIDDEFLEWFVKNSSCESVEVIYSSLMKDYEYELLFPKEEPTLEEEYLKDQLKKYEGIDVIVLNKPEEPKQETLDAAHEWVFETNGHNWSNNDDTAGDNYGSFIAGAEWQAERMYSEEEVYGMLQKLRLEFKMGVQKWQENFEFDLEEWFEQFKKK